MDQEIQNFFQFLQQDERTRKYLLQGTLLGLLSFILYLELSPKLGNIWYRITHTGNREIFLEGLINFFAHPFKELNFWYPENWDLNFITFSAGSSLIYTLLCQANNYRESK